MSRLINGRLRKKRDTLSDKACISLRWWIIKMRCASISSTSRLWCIKLIIRFAIIANKYQTTHKVSIFLINLTFCVSFIIGNRIVTKTKSYSHKNWNLAYFRLMVVDQVWKWSRSVKSTIDKKVSLTVHTYFEQM